MVETPISPHDTPTLAEAETTMIFATTLILLFVVLPLVLIWAGGDARREDRQPIAW